MFIINYVGATREIYNYFDEFQHIMLTMFFLRKKPSKTIGQSAEDAALKFLQRQGLTLIERNYHSRFGEIDIIMQEQNTLVFIEVRCRKVNAQVSAAESISPQKIQKIVKTAECYLMTLDNLPNCRFDVIAMTHNREKSGYTINRIKNAF